MKFAVFTVSIPEWTPDVAVDRLKAIGYDGVEWRIQDQSATPGAATFWGNNQATLPLSTLVEDAEAKGLEATGAWLKIPLVEQRAFEVPKQDAEADKADAAHDRKMDS